MNAALPPDYPQLNRLMQARDWRAAEVLCEQITAQHPASGPAWLAASHVALALGDSQRALDRAEHALRLGPNDPRLMMHRAQCLLRLGRRADAFSAAEAAEQRAPNDPKIRDAAGTLYSYGHDQERALAAYDAAVRLAPQSAQLLYNRASVRRFLGDLAGAECDYDAVIALRPLDYEAFKNRSDLRTQTPHRNHIAELERLQAQPIADWRGAVQVGYALAKEYEDVGEFARSFQHLSRAAARRRRHMRYDAATDVATVQWIMDAFPGPIGAMPAAAPTPQARRSPIFIIGLPRSGTTLAERILGSHSSLFSAGELDCFAQALTSAVVRHTGTAQLPRRELVARSADLDFAALGADYLMRARAETAENGRFIDKMPLNYLYCGLIKRALPDAKLVHMTRHPMAVCYAMYKTLFKDGYPFSYDLAEIAHYYLGYRRLMAHWQAMLPGQIYTLSYEALVADQEGESRKLLDFCGLEWQDGCVQFHENRAASTTASAAQVRRPIYDSSVSQWRRYENELAGLRGQLRAAGMET